MSRPAGSPSMGVGLWQGRVGEYNVSVNCRTCGKPFERRSPNQVSCSYQCLRYWNDATRPTPLGHPPTSRPCQRCGSPIPIPSARRSLCATCRIPPRECLRCGVTFVGKDNRRRYCSRFCSGSSNAPPVKTGREAYNWKGTDECYRGPGWRRLRDVIRERDGWRCRRCGKTPLRKHLQVHHIERAEDWTNPGSANDPSNLISLCTGCHRTVERRRAA